MRKLSILLILFAVLFGCNKKKEEIIIASVNDEILTLEEFKGNFSSSEWSTMKSEDKKDYINQWIDIMLLAQAADENGLSDNKKLQNRIKYAGMKIKGNAYINNVISKIKVTDEEALEYYNIHKNEYKTTKKELKIQQIVSDDKNKIESIKQKIWKGLKFKQAAIEFSEDKYAAGGGYVGFVDKEFLGEEIWNKLIKSKAYVFIQVKKDDKYYLIRQYKSRNVETIKSFLEVKDEVVSIVLKQKKNNSFEDIIKKVKQNSKIEIFN